MQSYRKITLNKIILSFSKATRNIAVHGFRLMPVTEAVVQRCSVKKVFLEISQGLQENTCARISFLTKLKPATLLKTRLWYRCFPMNFVKFLRAPIL